MNNIKNLKDVIDTIGILLWLPSGANEFQLQTAAYYVTATWHVAKFKKFPYLVLYGSTGVGKSDLLEALGLLSKRSVSINASGITPSALRELFDRANEGTALLEEFEDTRFSEEIERYLNARYSRQTQNLVKMTPVGDRGWQPREYHTFGATIMHRRDHFRDQAIENRAIWLHLPMNTTRERDSYQPIPDTIVEDLIAGLEDLSAIDLPNKPDWPAGIAPRVAETYDPILRLAQLADDKPYIAELTNHMLIADAAFRDGQTYEPKALVLRGLIACLTTARPSGNDTLNLGKSVEISEICRHLQQNYQRGLVPRQAAENLRELGFELRQSGGRTKVMGITAPQLAKACQETAIIDELVAKASGGTP